MSEREVEIRGVRGPLAGRRWRLRLGRAAIGRDPGPHGITIAGDETVSRLHGELLVRDGEVVYRNHSSNRSLVDGEIVAGEETLTPGAELRLGGETVLQVRFRRAAPERRVAEGGGNPIGRLVREHRGVAVGLLLYFLALGGLVLAVRGAGDDDTAARFAAAAESYRTSYAPAAVPPAELERRLERAERLALEVRALERAGRWSEARRGYHDLMALDGDPESPLYRFAARRLGQLAGRR